MTCRDAGPLLDARLDNELDLASLLSGGMAPALPGSRVPLPSADAG